MNSTLFSSLFCLIFQAKHLSIHFANSFFFHDTFHDGKNSKNRLILFFKIIRKIGIHIAFIIYERIEYVAGLLNKICRQYDLKPYLLESEVFPQFIQTLEDITSTVDWLPIFVLYNGTWSNFNFVLISRSSDFFF